MKIKRIKSNSGYTLVETLVAVSIFSISIIGVMVALSQGIADTGYAKKKIAAAYLAQEGVEYMRNLRDTYMIYGSGNPQARWNNFRNRVTTNCRSNRPCYVNPDNLDYADQSQPMVDVTITQCIRPRRGGCTEMLYDSTSGRYNYSSGQSSGFTREIVAERVGGIFSLDEIRVTSTVYWTQGSGDYNVSLTESLYSWIE